MREILFYSNNFQAMEPRVLGSDKYFELINFKSITTSQSSSREFWEAVNILN